MHKFASFNHEITDASKTCLSAVSSASLYGRGIFTTVALYHSKPFLWEKHWRRLTENANKIRIDLSEFSETEVKNSFLKVINKNNLEKGRARLTFFDETAGGIWNTNKSGKINLLITTADFRETPHRLRLTVSPYSINSKSPLAGVKSCNYLENLLALEEAKKTGFDEAIRLNEKQEVVSAAMANIFWVHGKEIFTPPIETGALDGTTRGFILDNLPVVEKHISLNELRNADEIFLTSAGIEIAVVESINERKSFRADEIVKIKKFFDVFKGNLT